MRNRSIENVLDELSECVNRYGIKHFSFIDDTLTLNHDRIKALCAGITSRGLDITWEGWTRANTINYDLLKIMRDAGFVRISFGIESGDPKISKLCRKEVPLDSYREGYKAAASLGIETRGSVVLGLPGETRKSALTTLRFAKSLKECQQIYINIATPYPSTELYDIARSGRHGMRLMSDDFSQYKRYGHAVIEVNNLTAKDLVKLQNKGFRMFYLTPGRIWYNFRRAGLAAFLINAWAFFQKCHIEMKVLVLSPAEKGARNVIREFMYGCWCRGRRIGGTQMPPTNLLYVATVLKEDGHAVELVDAGVDYAAYEKVLANASDYQAVIILTSTTSFRLDIQFCRELKEANPDIKTILFGAHPTFMPEYCLEPDEVDFIIRREPEFIIRDLLRALASGSDWKDILGIGYRESGRFILNELYPLIRNMDNLPIPDRSFLPQGIDYFNPVIKRVPFTTMQTSRGCHARCNFCTVRYFFGKRIRVRSAEKVLAEINHLIALGYKEIFIRDETFTAYKSRNIEICEAIIRDKLDVSWICNGRVDTVDSDVLPLMKRAGCHLIKFGVESGNQTILDNIKKGITLEQTREAFHICHRIGLDTHAHVMLGCPGETLETINQTINFVKQIAPTTASFGILTPYPGTDLFKDIARTHPEISDGTATNLAKLHLDGFFNQYFTSLSPKELEKYIRIAYRRFYLRPNYLLKKLWSLRDYGELMRHLIAASNILSFSFGKDN